jgi:hypothetical protein
MSEEMLQRWLHTDSEKIETWDFYNVGAFFNFYTNN